MNAYRLLQNYFMNEYIGNVNTLRGQFYDACSENVCKQALDGLLSMLTGENNCDIL